MTPRHVKYKPKYSWKGSFLCRFGILWHTLPNFIHFECRIELLVNPRTLPTLYSLLSSHLAYSTNCFYREHFVHCPFMCWKVKKFIKALCISKKNLGRLTSIMYLLMPSFLTKLKIQTHFCSWFQTLRSIFQLFKENFKFIFAFSIKVWTSFSYGDK